MEFAQIKIFCKAHVYKAFVVSISVLYMEYPLGWISCV